jgi:hypothetical protein
VQEGYVNSSISQISDAGEPGRPSLLRCSPKKKARCAMSKLLAIVASLKGILIAASVAFARGDMIPVILISVLFNLAELGAKPGGQVVPQDTIVVSPSDDDGR